MATLVCLLCWWIMLATTSPPLTDYWTTLKSLVKRYYCCCKNINQITPWCREKMNRMERILQLWNKYTGLLKSIIHYLEIFCSNSHSLTNFFFYLNILIKKTKHIRIHYCREDIATAGNNMASIKTVVISIICSVVNTFRCFYVCPSIINFAAYQHI